MGDSVPDGGDGLVQGEHGQQPDPDPELDGVAQAMVRLPDSDSAPVDAPEESVSIPA